MRYVLVLLLGLLAACEQPEAPAPSPSATATPEALSVLEGDLQVVDIDDRGLALPEQVVLHLADERIDFDNCQRIGWSATFEGEVLTTDRSPPPGEPCPNELPAWKLQMVSAIDAADQAQRLPDGRVKLTGRLRSLTLAAPR